MSSTVGYGFEVVGDYTSLDGEWGNVKQGEFEEYVSFSAPSLQVVISQPEYSDALTRYFVLIRKTVVTAGNDDSASVIPFTNPSSKDVADLHNFIKNSKITVLGKNNWFLVDYFAE